MASSSSCCFPDIFSWICTLPSIDQWKTDSLSICVCSVKSNQPSLNFSITKNTQNPNPQISFSLLAIFRFPIPLWTSSSFKLKTQSQKPSELETIFDLFFNFVDQVLSYGPNKKHKCISSSAIKTQLPKTEKFGDLFNLAFFSLALCICIYEAPQDLRLTCLNDLQQQLSSLKSREASKLFPKVLGLNTEEQWMRSINLAITNWIVEAKSPSCSNKMPPGMFSYALSAMGLWKVQLYCPMVAMKIENSSDCGAPEDRLMFSLRNQQVEGVIQLGYKLIFTENWIEVLVNVDNVRLDVVPLIPESLMAERGVGTQEKHFPSRISLQLNPSLETQVLTVSLSKSSDNPLHEIGSEMGFEAGIDPPNSLLMGLKVSATESSTMSMKPWKFEQSVDGNIANLDWFLHDSGDGREVFSSKPSMISMVQPRAWFKDRYSSAHRPFTKEGGVVFAGDEYGERVGWKVDKEQSIGKTMEWELRGHLWFTYWPNKYRTFVTETRRLDFKEILHLPLLNKPN